MKILLFVSALICCGEKPLMARNTCLFLLSAATPSVDVEQMKPIGTAFHDYTDLKAEWININTAQKALQALERLKTSKFSEEDRVLIYFIGPMDFQSDAGDFFWQWGANPEDKLSYQGLKQQLGAIPCAHLFTAFISNKFENEPSEPIFRLPRVDSTRSYRQLVWKGYFPDKATEWSKDPFFSSSSFWFQFSYTNCTKRLFGISDAVAMVESNGFLVGHAPEEFVKKRLLYIEIRENPLPYGTIIDPRDGTTYRTREIGCETWLVDNMQWAGAGKTNPAASGENTNYGRLYTWKEADKACTGLGADWQLPSSQHWEALPQYLGNSARALTDMPGGLQIKPGGWRTAGNYFDHSGEIGAYWTVFSSVGYIIHLPSGRMRPTLINSNYGLSCRCVKKLKKP